MNCYIKTSLYYAILGLVAGVFYREFTKYNGLDGGTSLAYIHVHTLMLGMAFFLIMALFEDKFKMSTFKRFSLFNITYNAGLVHFSLASGLITIFLIMNKASKEIEVSIEYKNSKKKLPNLN